MRCKQGVRIGLLHLLWAELSAAKKFSPIPQARLWMQSAMPNDERQQGGGDQQYTSACDSGVERN